MTEDTDAWQAPVRELQRRVAKLEDQLMALQPPEACSWRPGGSEEVLFPKQFTVRGSQFFLKMCPPFCVTAGVRPFPLAM